MTIESVDDQMIEIGDPNEEPTSPVIPPRVVIEYRDRGVPWMLIPPLIVLSAVAAILAHGRLSPRSPVVTRVATATTNSKPIEVETIVPPSTPPVIPAVPPAVEPEKPRTVVNEPPTVEIKAEAVAPGPDPEPTPMPTPVDPALENPIRAPGLGFDPEALEAAREVDPSLRPAAGADGPREVPVPDDRPAIPPVGPEQANEVDPGLLPVDPRLTLARRAQRIAEAKRLADADRVQFHAELRGICKKSGVRGAPEISKLCKKYAKEVDPAAKQQAARLLGKAGSYEGAGRALRINLLRSLGFPEPIILGDLMDTETRHEDHTVRGGIGSEDEALYYASVLLLNYAPRRSAKPAIPVSDSRPSPLAGSGPSQ